MLVFFCGVGNALVNVNAMVLITRHTADEVRGRVFAAVQGTISAAQIVSLAVGGLLLFAFAPRPIIVTGACLSVVALALTIAPVLRSGAPSLAPAADGGGHTSPTKGTVAA